MNEAFNIYCDESCHLENDHQKVMVLGAVWCPALRAHEINRDIRSLKESHGFNKNCEIKWTKVSPGQVGFYEALLDYFFANADLHFRSLIVPDKSKLRHEAFGQTHDDWYYKMYFNMLKAHDYVVVLERRKICGNIVNFLISAHHVDGESRRRSLNRRYEKRERP
ncbi:MAG: DUF3800 domain-containing protein [Acidobacteriota bacterium]|jgi:hypothetical protein